MGPARATGVTSSMSPGARGETLVAATSEAEGGLPLLQFALAELWEARDQAEGAITALALEAIGGVSGALARHADEVILAMTAVQRSAAGACSSRSSTGRGRRCAAARTSSSPAIPPRGRRLNRLVRGRLLSRARRGAGADATSSRTRR